MTSAVSRPRGTGPRRLGDYRGCMGRIFLILIAALAVLMVISAVIATLHLLFWIALIAVLVIGAVRLGGGTRRRSRS
jgi:hypothetical protein